MTSAPPDPKASTTGERDATSDAYVSLEEQRETLLSQRSSVSRTLHGIVPGPDQEVVTRLLALLASHRGDWLPLVVDRVAEQGQTGLKWKLLPLSADRFEPENEETEQTIARHPDETLWQSFLRLTAPLRSVGMLPISLPDLRSALAHPAILQTLLPWWPEEVPVSLEDLPTALRQRLSERAPLSAIRHPRSAAARFLALVIIGVQWRDATHRPDLIRACLYAPQLVCTPWRAWDLNSQGLLALHQTLAAGDAEFARGLLTRHRPQGSEEERFAGRSLAHHAAMGGLQGLDTTSTLHIEVDPRGFGNETPAHLAAASGRRTIESRRTSFSALDVCQQSDDDYRRLNTTRSSSRSFATLDDHPSIVPITESAPSEEELQLSRLFASRFRLLRLLGSGGFGSVFLAWDTLLERRVALKCPNPSALSAKGKYVLREIEAGLSIGEPSTARFLTLCHDGDRPGLVFEYLEGGDLASHLEKWEKTPEARPDAATLASLSLDIIDALEALHDAGLVHRDLKPQNLILELREDAPHRVRLIDLGAAKFRRKQTTQVAGSFDYMAPDFFTDPHAASPATDIYSLGIVLWELLSGQLPYRAESWQQAANMHMNEPVPAFRPRVPCPAHISDVLCGALAKEREKRPSLRQLRASFSRWLYQVRYASPDKRTILDEGGSLEMTTIDWTQSEAFELLFVGETASIEAQAQHVREGLLARHYLPQRSLVAGAQSATMPLCDARRAYAAFLSNLLSSRFSSLAAALIREASVEEFAALLAHQLQESRGQVPELYQLALSRDGGLHEAARQWWQRVLNTPDLRRVLSIRGLDELPEALRPLVTYHTRRLDALSPGETRTHSHSHAALERAFTQARHPSGARASLVELVDAGDRDAIVDALRRGALPNLDEEGQFPLHRAILRNDVDIISVLLSAGAELARHPQWWLDALAQGEGVVDALSDIHFELPSAMYADVLAASRKADWRAFNRTLDALPVEFQETFALERLRDAVLHADPVGAREAIAAYPLDAELLYDEFASLMATLQGRERRRTLRAARGSGFATACLHHALENANAEELALALQHRADPDGVVRGLSPLARAWCNEQWAAFPRLINAGASRWVVPPGSHGKLVPELPAELARYLPRGVGPLAHTSLVLTDSAEHLEIAELLDDILATDDPQSLSDLLERLDVDDITLAEAGGLLMLAAASSVRCLHWLLERASAAGAQPTDEGAAADSPLHIAATHGATPNLEVLLRFGYRCDAFSQDGATALHYAAQQGHYAACERLLEFGADPHLKTPQGYRCDELAERAGHVDLALFLRSHPIGRLPEDSKDTAPQ